MISLDQRPLWSAMRLSNSIYQQEDKPIKISTSISAAWRHDILYSAASFELSENCSAVIFQIKDSKKFVLIYIYIHLSIDLTSRKMLWGTRGKEIAQTPNEIYRITTIEIRTNLCNWQVMQQCLVKKKKRQDFFGIISR